MGVNREIDFFDGVFVLPRDRQLVNHLGRMRADDVRAEDFAVFLVAQDLHEAFGLARAARPAVRGERKLAGDIVELLLLALIFGEADARHLGMTVRHARHIIVFDGVRFLAGDDLGDDGAFTKSLVRQHRRPRHVADRVVAGRRRLKILVHLDEATVGQLNAAFLEADVFGVHRAPGGHQDRRSHDLFFLAPGLDIEGDLVLAHSRFRDLGAGDDVDATLAVALGQHIGRFGVLDGQNPRQGFDERDLHAERLENVGEFHPDRARADDGERVWYALEQQRFIRGDHRRLVDFQSDLRNAFHARAGGDDHRLLRIVDVAADLHLLPGLHHARALDDGDLVLLHEELDALRVLITHPARAFHRDAVVSLYVGDLNTKLFRFFENACYIRRLQKSLGRNAADVDTHAAHFVLFHHRRAEAELGAPNRADIARGAAAQDDDIETCHACSLEQHCQRGFQHLFQRSQEYRAGCAIDDAVIAAHRQTQAPPHHDAIGIRDGLGDDAADRDDAGLRRVDHRGELIDVEHAEVRNAERGARVFLGFQAAVAGSPPHPPRPRA